jgi:hypothetical protein
LEDEELSENRDEDPRSKAGLILEVLVAHSALISDPRIQITQTKLNIYVLFVAVHEPLPPDLRENPPWQVAIRTRIQKKMRKGVLELRTNRNNQSSKTNPKQFKKE